MISNTYRNYYFIRLSALYFILCFTPLIVRIILIYHYGIEFSNYDLWGFLSDILISTYIFLIVVLTARHSYIISFLFSLIWVVCVIGVYQYTSVLGSQIFIINFKYLLDGVFFFGSVITAQNFLMFAVLCLLLLLIYGFSGFPRANPSLTAIVVACSGLVVVLAAVSWVTNTGVAAPVANWRTENFLIGNLREAIFKATPAQTLPFELSETNPTAIQTFAADLSGTKRPRRTREEKSNVILLILEGISGAYLPDIARSRSVGATHQMKRLDQIARSGLSFSTFVAQQRQSNRGDYAILCGTMPKLSSATPKMFEFVNNGTRKCLPRILRDAGYETVYLQSAPLRFMSYDQFLPRAGYTRQYDDAWFKTAYARNEWAVDDRAFLEQSLKLVGELNRRGRPWFLTLVTGGTHHPYLVPPGFAGDRSNTGFDLALEWLDLALDDFVRALRKSGDLANTLLVITSDESAGVTKARNDLSRDLSQNWGLLIALSDSLEPENENAPYVQADIAISILDYVGLADRPHGMTGRSLFRKYDKPRRIYFANTYHQTVMELGTDGKVTRCDESLQHCREYSGGSDIFGSEMGNTVRQTEASRAFKQAQSISLRPEQGDASSGYTLQTSGRVGLPQPYAMIFGGQYISTLPGEAAELELDVEVSAPKDEHAFVYLKVRSDDGSLYYPPIPVLVDKDSFRLKARFASETGLRRLEVNLYGYGSGPGAELLVKTARVTILPAAEGRKPLEVEMFEVKRPGFRGKASYAVPQDWLQRPPCVLERDDGLSAVDCHYGSLLYGPYVSLAPGDRIKASYDITLRRGAAVLQTDVVSQLAGEGIQQSEPRALEEGERQRFVIEFAPDKSTNLVETRLRLVSEKSAELSIDDVKLEVERNAPADSLRLADCAIYSSSQIRASGCRLAPIIFGPYLPLRAGDRVKATFDVTVDRGSATLQTDVVSAFGREKHYESELIELTTGERRRFELNFFAPEAIDRVETRLHLIKTNEAELTIDDVTFTIER